MGLFSKWFGGDKAAAVAETVQPGHSNGSMTLDERMLFRRQMVLESVREVMLHHGLLSAAYRVSLARLDARGHQFAAMVDLVPAAAGRGFDSPAEFLNMEAHITLTAMTRYKVKVTGVYWRVVTEQGQTAASPIAVHMPAPTPAPKPPAMRRRTDHVMNDGFADTLVEVRPDEDSVSAEELAAFERALSAGNSPQSVSLGRRTYATDFSPLN
jgi:hypothetical protein